MTLEIQTKYQELANMQSIAGLAQSRPTVVVPPTCRQIERAEVVLNDYRNRIGSKMKIPFPAST